MKNIASAIIKVMRSIKGIEKTMNVGSGANSYKGMSDADVKEKICEAMAEAGLCILTTSVMPKTTIERWETTDYNGKPTVKQQVFTEVTTGYILLHESGETIELMGYGHGVDTQDKSAGKATTYALKNVLLYTFLVATKKIDDTDNHHSDEHEVPAKKVSKPILNPKHEKWQSAIKALTNGQTTIEAIKKAYVLTEIDEEKLKDALQLTV